MVRIIAEDPGCISDTRAWRLVGALFHSKALVGSTPQVRCMSPIVYLTSWRDAVLEVYVLEARNCIGIVPLAIPKGLRGNKPCCLPRIVCRRPANHPGEPPRHLYPRCSCRGWLCGWLYCRSLSQVTWSGLIVRIWCQRIVSQASIIGHGDLRHLKRLSWYKAASQKPTRPLTECDHTWAGINPGLANSIL